MRKAKAPFFIALAAIVVLSCSRWFGAGSVSQVAFPKAAETLDAVKAQDPGSLAILEQTQRPLVRLDADKKVQPELTEGWSLDVSGKRYTFVLGKHAWSDGVPVKAQDFVFAWKRHLACASPVAKSLLPVVGARKLQSGIDGVFGARAIGENLLEVELEKAQDSFVAGLADIRLGPQRQDVFESHPKDFTDPLHLRAVGPYQVMGFRPQQSVELAVNSYYPAQAALPRVRIVFPTANEAKSLVEQGKLAIAYLPSGQTVCVPGIASAPVSSNGTPLLVQVRKQ